jgi:hypothetical protein
MVAEEIVRVLESWRDNKRTSTTPAGGSSKKARLPTYGAGGSKGGRRLNLY